MKIFAIGMNYAEHNKSVRYLNQSVLSFSRRLTLPYSIMASLSSSQTIWDVSSMKPNWWCASASWERRFRSVSLTAIMML